MLRLHEDLVKSVLLQDQTWVEMTLEINSSKNKGFHGRVKELRKLHVQGRAKPAEVAYVDLMDRWVTHVFHLVSKHLEVCFKKSPSLNNK